MSGSPLIPLGPWLRGDRSRTSRATWFTPPATARPLPAAVGRGGRPLHASAPRRSALRRPLPARSRDEGHRSPVTRRTVLLLCLPSVGRRRGLGRPYGAGDRARAVAHWVRGFGKSIARRPASDKGNCTLASAGRRAGVVQQIVMRGDGDAVQISAAGGRMAHVSPVKCVMFRSLTALRLPVPAPRLAVAVSTVPAASFLLQMAYEVSTLRDRLVLRGPRLKAYFAIGAR